MSIGPAARKWFSHQHGKSEYKVYTSRFYTAEISYPKKPVWFLQVPIRFIDTELYGYVNLICQKQIDTDDYHYLKVPTKFLNEHIKKFSKIKNNLALYLSANPEHLFVEERGTGKLKFAQFLIS